MSKMIYYPYVIDPDDNLKRAWLQNAVDWFLNPDKILPLTDEQVLTVSFGVERQYDRSIDGNGEPGEYIRAWMRVGGEDG